MNAHFYRRTACPVCASNVSQPVVGRPYADASLRSALERFYEQVGRIDYNELLGASYNIHICDICGAVFQGDVPDDYILSKLYEEWISPAKAFARFHSDVSAYREREIRNQVRMSISLCISSKHQPRILDYGCGWGEWGRAALDYGAETWGTELSRTRREACHRIGMKVVAEDELPLAAFDVINADQVFEHLPRPLETLSLLKSLLRNTGVVRIAVPNGWRVRAALKHVDRELNKPRLGRLNPIAPLEHLNCFTCSTLVRLADRAGLVRVRPNWTMSKEAFTWPPGLRRTLKQMILPFFLRSNFTTQLWFRHASVS